MLFNNKLITLRDYLSSIGQLFFFNLLLGFVIIFVCQILPMDVSFFMLDKSEIPSSGWEIFANNVKFSFIYAVPYVGALLYLVAFIFIYAVIGIYVRVYGIDVAITHLLHLPLEVLGLSIPLMVSLNYKERSISEIFFLIFTSIMILLISSFVEISLG